MTVENPNVVDAIGTDKGSGEVILTITDHLPWDEPEHYQKLQEKLNYYLGFIEQGELIASYPNAQDKPTKISIVCKYQPSNQALLLLNKAAAVTKEYGVNLAWHTHNA